MTPKEQEFYENLFPCLRDRDWWHTGAQSFGSVRWRIKLPDIVVEDIAAAVQAGLIVLPNSSKLFAEIVTLDYPKEKHTCNLTVKAEQANSEEVKAIAIAFAFTSSVTKPK